ncbi:MAG: methyltransferase domain-containing protein [Bilifractor sp.]|jgi:trans-aconitate 2-methyltransferase
MTRDWNPDLYLRFKKERTQPSIDLANRIRDLRPETAADLGCGPGNSTAVLRSVFPETKITGIDSSENMIRQARQNHPDLNFRLCDVRALEGRYDLIFSNACLHWIPDHRSLIPELMKKLNPGGMLAVQFPMNRDEPLYRSAEEMSDDPRWGIPPGSVDNKDTLMPDEYYDILAGCSSDFQIWQCLYCHALPSHESLIDWIRGTRLRRYESHLSEEQSTRFEEELLRRTKDLYPVHSDGRVLLHFRRFFFTAKK